MSTWPGSQQNWMFVIQHICVQISLESDISKRCSSTCPIKHPEANKDSVKIKHRQDLKIYFFCSILHLHSSLECAIFGKHFEVNLIVDNLPAAASVPQQLSWDIMGNIIEAATKYIRRSDGNEYMCPPPFFVLFCQL